jgi:Holliday junction DNA helicase RuvA
MIGRLRGILIEKQAPDILVDVQGVCYEVRLPMTSIYHLPDVGMEVILHTHLSVSETAQQLFGFVQQRDRLMFRELIKVNGVGPKMALAILSGMEADVIVRNVMDDNAKALVNVPGVGKKTAERLVIDLRDRLKTWQTAPGSTATAAHSVARSNGDDVVAEAESALIALGYKPTQALQIVIAVQKEHQVDRSEELIRLALRSLA